MGDAALTFDPLSSQGLFNALSTGLAGAEAAHRHLQGDRHALAGYSEELNRIWSVNPVVPAKAGTHGPVEHPHTVPEPRDGPLGMGSRLRGTSK